MSIYVFNPFTGNFDVTEDTSNLANKSLSNLTSPTNVNQPLLTNTSVDIGTSSARFGTIHGTNIDTKGDTNGFSEFSTDGNSLIGVIGDFANSAAKITVRDFGTRNTALHITTDNRNDGITTGNITSTTGNGNGSGNTGDIDSTTGDSASGNSGNITLKTGEAPSAIAGDIILQPGGGDTPGKIVLTTGTITTTTGVISKTDAGNLTIQTSSGDIGLSPGTGIINASNSRIINAVDPINPQDVATKNFVTTQTSLYIPLTQKAATNGVATLDGGGKVPVAQLPNSIMEFQGVWNATTNTPTLVDGTGNIGDVYRVNVAGTQNLGSGSQTFVVGDWVMYDAGGIWRLAHAGADAVLSVNGSAGIVTVDAINQLTGDVTAGPASGSASAAATLATVNANVGSFGTATNTSTITVNAKGLITAASNTPIQITEAQVTNLTTDLAGKQATGNYVTSLTGDVTGSGPGATTTTLATVNGNVGTFGDATHTSTITVNAKGLITAASNTSIQITEAQVTNLTTDLAGKQATGNYITALTGDATATGPGSVPITLATVNGNVGSFGSSTSIPSFTVNGKGLITAASGNAVVAPAGTLSGTTLNSTVVSSSLTSVGTITSGTWTGTTIALANGGTGQTTKAAAFDALSPMTTGGDLIYGGASGTGTRLANGTSGQVLTSSGGTAAPTWSSATTFVAPTIQTFTIPSGTPATYTTPTSPRAPLYLRIRMVGGGGGGGGGGTTATAGGTGGNTTFGTATATGAVAVAGGTPATIGPITGIALVGGRGGGVVNISPPNGHSTGGMGAASPFGGAGAGRDTLSGVSAVANTGSGGGGGGCNAASTTGQSGEGGGAGAYIEGIIVSPSATYSYTIGAGGAGGTAGTSGTAGGAGADGYLEVTAYYQ